MQRQLCIFHDILRKWNFMVWSPMKARSRKDHWNFIYLYFFIVFKGKRHWIWFYVPFGNCFGGCCVKTIVTETNLFISKAIVFIIFLNKKTGIGFLFGWGNFFGLKRNSSVLIVIMIKNGELSGHSVKIFSNKYKFTDPITIVKSIC